MEKFKPFTKERPWGNFRQLTHNSSSTVKIHKIKPGEATSWQSHAKRSEFWYIVSGDGQVLIEDKKYNGYYCCSQHVAYRPAKSHLN